VTSSELKRFLESKGCAFAPGKGGHLRVMRGNLVSVRPMHGKNQDQKQLSLK